MLHGTEQISFTTEQISSGNKDQKVGIGTTPAYARSELLAPPLLLKTGTEFVLPVEEHDDFQKAFPLVDFFAELRKMRLYYQTNPDKRKTPRGIRRAINFWMGRRQSELEGLPDRFSNAAEQAPRSSIGPTERCRLWAAAKKKKEAKKTT